jgi:hypothetical protein
MGKKTTLAALAFVVCVGLLALSARAGTQQCNTACQSRMTDCILSCDGRVSCEEGCKSRAVDCVAACTDGGTTERADTDGGAVDAAVTDARADRVVKTDAAKDASLRDR